MSFLADLCRESLSARKERSDDVKGNDLASVKSWTDDMKKERLVGNGIDEKEREVEHWAKLIGQNKSRREKKEGYVTEEMDRYLSASHAISSWFREELWAE